MTTGDAALVALQGVTKDYRGLRPLRVASLHLAAGQSLALLGFDHLTAEVLVNLITGAVLPDTGTVTVFGRATSAITDADAWVETLDRIGLISERAVFLDQLSAEQNLAMPFTLELDTMPDAIRATVGGLAAEVGLSADDLRTPVSALPPLGRMRTRLARALALGPRLLLAEHPNAQITGGDVSLFAADLARVVNGRGLASIVITADAAFASLAAADALTLQPATGELRRAGGWRRWFS